MSGRLVFTTLPPGAGPEGGGEVLGFFTGVGSMFSSSCGLGGRVQGVVKGGVVSRSSFCSPLGGGDGCWLAGLCSDTNEFVAILVLITCLLGKGPVSLFLYGRGAGHVPTDNYASSDRRGSWQVQSPGVWNFGGDDGCWLLVDLDSSILRRR